MHEYREQEKKRRLNLYAMLTPPARERLDRLALVNKAKADAVGDHIVALAEEGFIAARVTDEQMKGYLDEVTSNQNAKVKIQRKKDMFESDDDFDDDDL